MWLSLVIWKVEHSGGSNLECLGVWQSVIPKDKRQNESLKVSSGEARRFSLGESCDTAKLSRATPGFSGAAPKHSHDQLSFQTVHFKQWSIQMALDDPQTISSVQTNISQICK